MNNGTSRPDFQKPTIWGKSEKVTIDWILPILLAVVVSGQIHFSAAKFYLGIERPAWPFWGLLILATGLGMLRKLSFMRATRLDMAMYAFVAILTSSFLFLGLGDVVGGAFPIASFILLPYLAGRLLDGVGARRFIFASLVITFLSVPLIGFGLGRMTESDLHTDRISVLFAAPDSNSMAGVSTIPHASVALGLFLILLTVIISFAGMGEKRSRQPILVALMCITVWMLIYLGLRSVILAALLISVVLIVFGQGAVIRRVVILGILLFSVVASWLTIPAERGAHFKQLHSLIDAERGAHFKQLHSLVDADARFTPDMQRSRHYFQSPCVVYGNSIETRMHTSDAAFKLFLDSPLIGVGAGNFGLKSECNFGEAFASPHGVLQQILSETGLIGLVTYFALIGYAVRGFVQAASSENARPLWLAYIPAIWSFFLLQALISGNYFFDYQFFVLTGVVGGLIATQHKGPVSTVDSRNRMW